MLAKGFCGVDSLGFLGLPSNAVNFSVSFQSLPVGLKFHGSQFRLLAPPSWLRNAASFHSPAHSAASHCGLCVALPSSQVTFLPLLPILFTQLTTPHPLMLQTVA